MFHAHAAAEGRCGADWRARQGCQVASARESPDGFFAEYLGAFHDWLFNGYPNVFVRFAKVLLHEKASVLTFNYDTLVEEALETVSRLHHGPYPISLSESDEMPDEELSYSHFNWNRPRAYGVKFDDVQLHRAGVSKFVEGSDFYGYPGNELYEPPLLKLHGSINWFVHSGLTLGGPFARPGGTRKGRTLLYRAMLSVDFPTMRGNELLAPIIVTPVLNKRLSTFPILAEIWTRAARELSSCRRLVVVGYSFPPTDFHVRRLLREAFYERAPDELIIVNPDTSTIHVAKDLCNFRGPVLAYENLEEFVSRTSGGSS